MSLLPTLLHLAIPLAGGGGGAGEAPDPTVPAFQSDAPTLVAYVGWAISIISAAVVILDRFSKRRRRREQAAADAATAAQTGKTTTETGAIRDATQLDYRRQDSADLAAEREYAREERALRVAADAELRQTRHDLDRLQRRTEDAIDDLRDRLRELAQTVFMCPVPNPPGCPLGDTAHKAITAAITAAAAPAEPDSTPPPVIDAGP